MPKGICCPVVNEILDVLETFWQEQHPLSTLGLLFVFQSASNVLADGYHHYKSILEVVKPAPHIGMFLQISFDHPIAMILP